jgi:hypothetical protein
MWDIGDDGLPSPCAHPDGRRHSPLTSGQYTILEEGDPFAGGQRGWRRCRDCKVLFPRTPLLPSRVRPWGVFNQGQGSWFWCWQCEGAFYGVSRASDGTQDWGWCPATKWTSNPGPHDSSQSRWYSAYLD